MTDSKISKVPEVLYRVPKSISRVPNEVWEGIRSNLPYLSSHALRRILGYEATSEEDSHSRIWSYFFKSEDWLNAAYNEGVNPCLIGYDLYPLLHDKHSAFNVASKDNAKGPKCLYLALVFGRENFGRASESLKTNEMRALLFKSLQPSHTILGHDLLFANGSRLNISDIVQQDEYTNVTYPRQLVSRKLDSLHSACLYWKNESRVCNIKPKDVFGIGKGLTKKNVSNIVGLNWKNLPSGVQQHVFAIPGMLLQTKQVINDGKMTSFEWLPRWEINTPKGIRSNMLSTVIKEDAERKARQAKERQAREAREEEVY